MTRRRLLSPVCIGVSLMFGGLLAGASAAPASATEELRLESTVATMQEGASVVSDIEWTLPADAASGDVVVLTLPAHAGGTLADGTWIAETGAVIGTASVGADGAIRIMLTDAADQSDNRAGRSLVTTTTTTEITTPRSTTSATATLEPGHLPGEFFGIADRDGTVKYGHWVDADETSVRWTIEAPRGPWEMLTIVDALEPGQQLICDVPTADPVRVRSTTQTDPETGYLVDLAPVEPSRVVVECADSALTVAVSAVATDEIVEVSFVATVDVPASVVSNSVSVTGSRAPETLTRGVTTLEHLQRQTPPPPTPPAPQPPAEATPPPTPVGPEAPQESPPPLPPELAATGAPAHISTLGTLVGLTVALGIACIFAGRGVRARGRA
ncbi:hypothetical protein [Microbacterium aurantiacum]|uniref:SDR-like Ig domain-containing protein n=1 Tax=Microbacterium aurantiacum TaxID=162393 RepID=A0ABT8FWK4_9MICO|nr:hypothetical protein [Microbacterium aurantiacum]MDN4465692.1 hypothetical protein [Microbacterium aurantiacum]